CGCCCAGGSGSGSRTGSGRTCRAHAAPGGTDACASLGPYAGRGAAVLIGRMPGCCGGPASPTDPPFIPQQRVVLAAMARRIETGSIDIEAIKDQYPLAETVSQHVALKRR